LIRYVALATVIVLGVAVLSTAWLGRDLIRIKIASVVASAPPKPEAPEATSGSSAAAFSGDAPWALSALPECLIQVSAAHGTRGYVLAQLPHLAPVVPPARLVYGDCTISVAGDEAIVVRGTDRFRIPPVTHFYRGNGTLAVLRESGGRFELRTYQPSTLR
jgi:hypothetical protein